MKLGLDWRAVLAGAAVALTLAIPTLVVIWLITSVADVPDDSNLWFLGPAFLFGEMLVGGARAGRLRPEAPLMHGGMSALVAYAPILVFVLTVSLLKHPVAANQILSLVSAILFGILTFTSAGVFGGMLTTRRRRRRPSPARRATP